MSDDVREPDNERPIESPEVIEPRAESPIVVPSRPVSPPHRATSAGPSIGTLLLGAILVLAGIGWILQASGVLDVEIGTILPAALILVGVALVVSARSGSHGRLITIGVILTLVLTVANAVSIPLTGNAGDFTDTPSDISQVKDEYTLMAGQRTLDLRDVRFPTGETQINIRSGMGQLDVYVPANVGVRVKYRLTAGEATVFGRMQDGIFQDGEETSANYGAAQEKLFLDIEHGLGQIEVRQ